MPIRSSTRRPLATVALAILATLGSVGPTAAQTEQGATAILDRPLVDVAVLPASGDDTLQLLTVEPPTRGTVRIARVVLAAGGPSEVAELEVAVEAGLSSLGTPWLVGLAPDRFALIVPSITTERTLVAGIDVDAGGGLGLDGEALVEAAIDDGAAADVDGDGAPELVLAAARTLRRGGTCQGSTYWTMPAGLDGAPRARDVEGLRLAGGVIGRWDDQPGDDLLAYAYPNCPAGPDDPTRAVLAAIRLGDGGLIHLDDVGGERLSELPWLGPPARLDLDGRGTHEAVAMTEAGLAILDPERGWSPAPLSDRLGFPVVAAVDHGLGVPGRDARVAWLDLGGPDAVATAVVGRGADGSIAVEPGHRPGPTRDPRSDPVVIEAIGALAGGGGVWGWLGALDDAACPVLLVPGASIACPGQDSLPGPTWIGSRPLAAYGPPDARRLVVAGGLVMDRAKAYPATPTPWVSMPVGAWRHGPSAPFVLGDVAIDSVIAPSPGGLPSITLAEPVAVDGTVRLSGPGGVRAFVLARPLADGDPHPGPAPGWGAFVPRSGGGPGPTVVRLPTSSDAASPAIPLPGWDDAAGTRRWALTIAAVDDRGVIARPVIRVAERDLQPPAVELGVPFLSAPWPFAARLAGRAEPGSTVTLDDGTSVPVAADGTFTLPGSLAPWPQTVRVTARDPVGNETQVTASVIGGIDYRQLPWIPILAVTLLAAAGLSGIRGARSRARGGPTPRMVGPGDEIEIEELPTGSARLR